MSDHLKPIPKSDDNLKIINIISMFVNIIKFCQEFLNNFQAAQQAIIEASSQAADAARANVQNAYQNSIKVAMRVRFAAPIIIIPENSTSMNALLIDFGRMTLNNKFVDLHVGGVSIVCSLTIFVPWF